MMSKYFLYFLPLFLLVGCRSDGPEEHQATLYNIVEVQSPQTFHLFKPDGRQPFLLTASEPLTLPDSMATTRQCIMLAYRLEDGAKPYADAAISPQGFSIINNAQAHILPSEQLSGWNLDPVYLMSLWRAGRHICLRLQLPYDDAPRRFALVVDSATVAEPYPQAYLFHRRADLAPSFERQYYAAFDVAALWALPTCQGLDVNIANTNLTARRRFRVAKYSE